MNDPLDMSGEYKKELAALKKQRASGIKALMAAERAYRKEYRRAQRTCDQAQRRASIALAKVKKGLVKVAVRVIKRIEILEGRLS